MDVLPVLLWCTQPRIAGEQLQEREIARSRNCQSAAGCVQLAQDVADMLFAVSSVTTSSSAICRRQSVCSMVSAELHGRDNHEEGRTQSISPRSYPEMLMSSERTSPPSISSAKVLLLPRHSALQPPIPMTGAPSPEP
jgi:hypothetical protein